MRRILGAWGLLMVTALPAQQATCSQKVLGEALCDPLATLESVPGQLIQNPLLYNAETTRAETGANPPPPDALANQTLNISVQGPEINLAQRAGDLIFHDPQVWRYQPMDIPSFLQNVILLTVPAHQPPSAFMGPLLSLWGRLQRHHPPEVVARNLLNMLPRLIVRLGRVYTGAPQTSLSEVSDSGLSLEEDFLTLLSGESRDAMPEVVTQARIRMLEAVLVSQVRQEMGVATQAVRRAAAAGVDIVGAVGIGMQIAAGDSQSCAAVLQMLRYIENSENIPAFIGGAAHADALPRLPGFGTDQPDSNPTLVRDQAIALLKVLKNAHASFSAEAEHLLQVALALEKYIAQDPVCRQHNLHPTPDLYVTVAYLLLGIPEAMHDTVSLMGRCVGWMAQGLQVKPCGGRHAPISNISGIKAH